MRLTLKLLLFLIVSSLITVGKIIDSYIEIKNMEEELTMKENSVRENREAQNSMKEKVEQGEATELEYEFLQVDSLKIELYKIL